MSEEVLEEESRPLRILYLEDEPKDAELVGAELEKLGRPFELSVSESKESYLSALDGACFDIILSDNMLPGFDGMEALDFARQSAPETPFVFVSGTLGEEQAIESLKAGATDYVLKDKLGRLCRAVERALAESAERRERRLAEESLRRTHYTLKTLIAGSPVAIFTLDTKRRVGAVWNEAAEQMFGWSWEELHGKEPPFVPDDRQWEFLALTEKVFRGESVSAVVLTRMRKDGTLIDVKLSAAPQRDDSGEVTGCVAFLTDMTAERRAIAERAESDQRFRSLFDNAPVSHYVTDLDGTLIDGNRRAVKLTGYEKEELIGKRLDEAGILPEHEVPRFYELLALNRDGHATGPTEIALIRADGTRVLVEVYAQRMVLQGRHVVLGTAVDITERNALQQQLLHAQRLEAVGQLAGGVAHDFNNILTAVGGYVHLAKSSLPSEHTVFDYLANIEHGVQRASRLTQQLLLFGRKAHVEKAHFAVPDAIQGILKMLGRVIGENIEIHTDLAATPCVVHGDRTKIEQVIMNLVVNARDAMPDGGRLTIRLAVTSGESEAAQRGSYLRLSVADTGVGIDEDTRLRLFEPFFTTKGTEKGTGLGLPVVLGIVEEHEGWLDVESAPGVGSTFHVYLPLAADQSEIAVAGESTEQESRHEGAAIALVEDDEHIVASARMGLSAAGYDVTVAKSLAAAKELFSALRRPVDLLITDMILPDGTGLDVADLVGTTESTRVIVVSGYIEDTGVHRKMLERGYRFVQKPYSYDELTAVIEEELSKRD